MKRKILAIFMIILSSSFVFGVSNPVTQNGKTYYKVDSTDPTEDSGDEVCGKVGLTCVGYTEPTSVVCKQFNPSAAEISGISGDASGVFCDGAPQSGVCSSEKNTCHTCPTCTVGISCSDAIGGLYKEAYVECAAPVASASCSVSLSAKDLNSLVTQLPGLNAQLAACPQSLPKGSGLAMSDGETQVDITRTSGTTTYLTITKKNGQITGIKSGASASCKQKVTISEADLNTALQSTNVGNAFAYFFGQKNAKISGCSFLSGTRLFFVGPIASFFAKRQAPTPPPAPPAPNCGQVGEQCNNRGCFSGICGAQKTQLPDGRWGFWDYECIDQSRWDALCQGRGNSPAPWSCITGICS